MQDVLELNRDLAHSPPNRPPSGRVTGSRYVAVESSAWIGWNLEAGAHVAARRRNMIMPTRTVSALILDFSQSGSLLLADELPATGEPAWIGLTRLKENPCVEIVVVSAVRTAQGPHLLHVAFKTPCPYLLFKAVVLGSIPIGNDSEPARVAH